MKIESPLEIFRKLAKADEEQSFVQDLSIVLGEPMLFVAVGRVMMELSMISFKADKTRGKATTENSASGRAVLSVVTLFAILYAIDFDLGIQAPFSRKTSGMYATEDNYNDTHFETEASSISGKTSSVYKPYTSYANFYEEAYSDAHKIPVSRVSHMLLASSVMCCWIYDSRLFVASLTALMTGAICTKPLASFVDRAFVEMVLVLTAGLVISRAYYGVPAMIRWLIFFVVWESLDYFDHLLLGHNGSVAIYLGQHYISWALIGQLQLATGMVCDAVTMGLSSTFTP